MLQLEREARARRTSYNPETPGADPYAMRENYGFQ